MPHRAPEPDERIIRLKPETEPEPSDDDDVYDGDLYGEPGSGSAIRRWAKRIVLIGLLAVLGFVGWSTWRTWLPKAETFGVGVVAAIDQRVRPPSPPAPSAEETERRQREEALAVASEQLPHLAPETIQILMADSLSGVLEPPEVFRRAQDAVERGRPALAPEEAQELGALQDQLLAALAPGEQNAFRIYEAVRRTRVTLQFEDRDALALLARGARALPSPSLDRLRELSGRAIAAAPASPLPTQAAPAETPAS